MTRQSHFAILALLAGALGCSDRPEQSPTAPPDAVGIVAPATTPAAAPGGRAERAAQERLARRMAVALADPAFRAYVKDALDRSPHDAWPQRPQVQLDVGQFRHGKNVMRRSRRLSYGVVP